MSLTGKYDFRGIKKYGAKVLLTALAGTTWGASFLSWGFAPAVEFLFEYVANWLANKGLIIINVGIIPIDGAWDQKAFDAHMQEALDLVRKGNLSKKEMKEIDDKVLEAFRRFAVIGNGSL